MALTFEGILLEACNYILAHHVTRLATGYLGFTLPEISKIQANEREIEMVQLECLRTFCIKNPDDAKEVLCKRLKEAGQKEGIVQKRAIDIIKGNLFYKPQRLM